MQSSHTDFGQAGFPQYSYSPSLSSVQGTHDMGKPVVGGQPGMYPNAGGMQSAAQQHHQSAMGGPVPSQQNSLVQQGQQMNRGNHIQMPVNAAFINIRGPMTRGITNMARAPTVVNQAGQQASSHYGHPMHVIPQNYTQHPAMSGPMMVNQFMHFQPRATINQSHPQQHYPMVTQNVYPWGNYNNQPAVQSSNGYFPQQMYNNALPPQINQTFQQPSQPPQPVQQPLVREKKIIAIIDPNSGKNIMDNIGNELPAKEIKKETENAPVICAQFATQVAVALTQDVNCESLSKSPTEAPEMMEDENVLCPEMGSMQDIDDMQVGDRSNLEKITDIESTDELADTESLTQVEYIENQSIAPNSDSVTIYNEDSSINSIIEKQFELEKSALESVQNIEQPDSTIVQIVPESNTCVENESYMIKEEIEKLDVGQPNDQSRFYDQQLNAESSAVDSEQSSITTPEFVHLGSPSSAVDIEDSKSSDAPDDYPSLKIPERLLPDGKKGKSKRKKDYNKRGENKEGGEMDAFLLTEEDSVLPAPIPPPAPERIPSPVPIVDKDVLRAIPLPGDTPPSETHQSDISPGEPLSETSSLSPSAENEEKENTLDTPKVTLKYSYKEDQWSPLNPEGKKQYDRDFLIQMQSQPMSLCRPLNLPNLDVIKDKFHIQKLSDGSRPIPQVIPAARQFNDPFVPVFARPPPSRFTHQTSNRRSQPRDKTPRKIVLTSLTKDVKLHESENAWKPMYKTDNQAQDQPGDETEKEKLKRAVQGVLNKLTPQKFDTLLQQLKQLNIDNKDNLSLVIDLIFEKAIDEPNFSVPYANMCKHLAMTRVPLGDPTAGQFVNFRKLLLTKCQKEFEQDRTDELKNVERLKAIETADPDKKKELKLEFDREEKKMRYRQLGNIRFIGELFKLNMLTEPIMHDCIKKLLSQGDEESLECLCKLLKTIGKELDEGKASKSRDQASVMDVYFNEMQNIVDKRLTSSRVRFMLQDVIDLKKCAWVPRRDENNPKTIDQIHKEAEREAREQQQNLQNMSYAPKRMPDDRDRRKNAGRNMSTNEDGWISNTKSNKGSYSVVDATKLKLSKPDEVDSMRLGPSRPMMWGKGSSGGNKAPESDKPGLQNRFNALAEVPPAGYEGRRGSQRSAASSRESSRGRNSGQQMSSAIRKTSSNSKERENLLETVKSMNRPGSTEVKAPESKAPDVQLNGKANVTSEYSTKDLSEDEMDKKTKALIDEFLHNNDPEEAIRCVVELVSPSTVHFFMNSAINQVLERSSQARYSLGQLFNSLVKKKIITFDHYKKGFTIVLEGIDDFAIDIPMIWYYIGEILEPTLEDKEIPFSFLKDVLAPCIPSETAGLLMSAVLHSAAKKTGSIKLGEVWRESGLQWLDFLGPNANVNDFIQKQKLEFTICPTKVKLSSQLSQPEVKKHLKGLLEKLEENEVVFDWIDANVSENNDHLFIRALVSAVLENVIKGNSSRIELNQKELKKRIPLLLRYIGKNENSELQALFAIQALMHKLEASDTTLRTIFDILYDDDVITEDTFKRWEVSEDPAEAEGKAAALESVTGFFTWLRESDES